MLSTERRNPDSTHLDRLPAPDALRLMNDANRRSVEAVEAALPAIARVAEAAAAALAAGGRIVYVGAGTSGRLAVQDAAECPPTFGVDPGTVVALMAGGREAMFRAAEGVEDDEAAGRRDLLALGPGPRDLVLGVSAAGGAAYVVGALRAAKERGAVTASLSSNSGTAIEREADLPIFVDTGAEVLTGSTRLKAGNAQKMVLNMVSTVAMARTGKVVENLMVNLRPSNRKLRARMVRIVATLAGVAEDRAEALLEANGWSIPAAIGRTAQAAPRVVLPDAPTAVEREAAARLADGLFRMSHAEVPLVAESAAADSAGTAPFFSFFVGATRAAEAAADGAAWAPDEILVRPVEGGMVLAGHPDRGPIYAVDTLLEEGYGVRWWTAAEADWPTRPVLPAPRLDRRHAPPFRYREVSALGAYDPAFRVRLKGNFVSRIRWATEDARFVPPALGGCHRMHFFEGRQSAYHSFFEILPPSRHFAAHPEWYSLVGGERAPKQLCLTNPEMEAAFVEETLRRLRADPDSDFLSVSQNDWQGACECDACRAVEAETGGVPSGPLLRFVNRVAEAVEREFPRVTVETFAYQYTRRAPRGVRPRRNVLVRLCDIECPFSTPLATARDPASRAFVRDLEDWTALAPGQVFVWDYVTDFHDYLLPHPNLFSLGPNVRLFAEKGAVGVFEQGDTCSGAGELAPLRTWLLSHLLWDPAADDRALAREFARGYWGAAAAPHVLRYAALVNGPPAAGEIPVRCYHADCAGWMAPATLVAAALAMEDAADAASSAGEPYASRVRRELLSPRHAILLHWDACRAFCKSAGVSWRWGEDRAAAARAWLDDCRAAGVRTTRETTAAEAPARFAEHAAALLA